jgi:vancomycin permeability regulator SanA
MSGGRFEYKQHHIQDIIDGIQCVLDGQNLPIKEDSDYSQPKYSPKTIKKFQKAVKTLKKAYMMAHSIDYLLCGDTSEDSFNEHWKIEMKKIKEETVE